MLFLEAHTHITSPFADTAGPHQELTSIFSSQPLKTLTLNLQNPSWPFSKGQIHLSFSASQGRLTEWNLAPGTPLVFIQSITLLFPSPPSKPALCKTLESFWPRIHCLEKITMLKNVFCLERFQMNDSFINLAMHIAPNTKDCITCVLDGAVASLWQPCLNWDQWALPSPHVLKLCFLPLCCIQTIMWFLCTLHYLQRAGLQKF